MPEKILIIRFSSLGDVILTSPTALNLRISYPDAEITFLTKEQYTAVAKLIPGVDEVVSLPNQASLTQLVELILSLDERGFSHIIDLHGNFRSWWARQLISTDFKTFYPKRRRERLLAVHRKILPTDTPHTIDLYNAAITDLGVPDYSRRPLLRTDEPRPDSKVTEFLNRPSRFVVIAPGAAHPNKQWPIERFVEVARILRSKHELNIFWAVTEQDEPQVTSLLDKKAVADSLLLQNSPIETLAAVIRQGVLTIANDSGIGHLSSAVGTPVIAVFGPTHPALGFTPRGLFDKVVEVDEFCRPCSLHGRKPCYREERFCFSRISAESVAAEAAKIVETGIDARRAVFIDRDGTLIKDKHFLSDPNDIEFESSSIEALRIIKSLGYHIFVVSNQSGVARGYFDVTTVERIHQRISELLGQEGVVIDGWYYCPHFVQGTVAPYNRPCLCRKPHQGMIEQAALQLKINPRASYMIGDKPEDVNTGLIFGGKSILVRTGYGKEAEFKIGGKIIYSQTTVADNLLEAARIIGRQAN